VTILITTLNLYERKVKQLVERLPSLRYIILTDAAEHLSDKILSFPHSWSNSTDFKIPETNPEDAFTPFYQWNYRNAKGVLHASCFFTHYAGKYVLDFHEDRFCVPLIRVG
jgi:acetyl-CoA synthetase